MPIGTVKWFNAPKGYGFVAPDDGGEELFARQTTVQMDGFRALDEGVRVSYELETGPNGAMAINMSPAP